MENIEIPSIVIWQQTLKDRETQEKVENIWNLDEIKANAKLYLHNLWINSYKNIISFSSLRPNSFYGMKKITKLFWKNEYCSALLKSYWLSNAEDFNLLYLRKISKDLWFDDTPTPTDFTDEETIELFLNFLKRKRIVDADSFYSFPLKTFKRILDSKSTSLEEFERINDYILKTTWRILTRLYASDYRTLWESLWFEKSVE